MSSEPKSNEDEKENYINNNVEAQELRNIFNQIEENNRKKNIDKDNNILCKVYNNQNNNLNNLYNISGIYKFPKNKYKLKLQNILFRNKI